jgi:hypothetical protein
MSKKMIPRIYIGTQDGITITGRISSCTIFLLIYKYPDAIEVHPVDAHFLKCCFSDFACLYNISFVYYEPSNKKGPVTRSLV